MLALYQFPAFKQSIYLQIIYLMRNKSKRSRWFIHPIITTACHSITTAKNPRRKIRTRQHTEQSKFPVSFKTFCYSLQFRIWKGTYLENLFHSN